jgi:DNA mismatch repair protein MSH6
MIKILRSSPVSPSFFYIPSTEIMDFRDSVMIIEHYLSSEAKRPPKLINDMIEDINENKPAVSALGNAIKYLESLKIVEKTIPLSTFFQYSHERMLQGKSQCTNQKMILDAQVLENLEIFEVQQNNTKTSEGSLFKFIDKCSTKFGQRLLKNWL